MLKKRLNSFRYALQGIGRLFKTQANSRVHLVATLAVILVGLYFEIPVHEWCVLVLCIFGVLAAEAFNTAIEDLTDLVSPDHHPLAGHAKDLAAGAVLLTSIGAALVGALVFVPKLLALLGQ